MPLCAERPDSGLASVRAPPYPPGMSQAPQPTAATPPVLSKEEWFSGQLVLVIQLVFAIVIAQSLSDQRAIVTDPANPTNRVAALALVVVYLTALWSWIRWHKSITGLRYRLYDEQRFWERARDTARFYLDLFIVIAYAYLLFRIDPMKDHNAVGLARFLDGYIVVGLLYFVWSFVRLPVSRRRLTRNGVYLLILVGIRWLYPELRHDSDLLLISIGNIAANYIALLAIFAATVGYRFLKPSWK
jgi:hypothetical protein